MRVGLAVLFKFFSPRPFSPRLKTTRFRKPRGQVQDLKPQKAVINVISRCSPISIVWPHHQPNIGCFIICGNFSIFLFLKLFFDLMVW
jgi:hypothetical protein